MYLLEVAKGGVKLQAPDGLDPDGTEPKMAASRAMNAASAELRAGGSSHMQTLHLASATVSRFADILSSCVDLPVRDATGLQGFYSFTIKWVPDCERFGGCLIGTVDVRGTQGTIGPQVATRECRD